MSIHSHLSYCHEENPFDTTNLSSIYKKLSQAENQTEEQWGGSDLVGGSPRNLGSSLSPQEVVNILN